MDQECQSCWCTKVDREQSLIYKVAVKVLNILTDKGSTRCKSLVKSSIEPAASRTPNLLFILCDKVHLCLGILCHTYIITGIYTTAEKIIKIIQHLYVVDAQLENRSKLQKIGLKTFYKRDICLIAT